MMELKLFLLLFWITEVLSAYNPEKAKEIRTATLEADTYDPLARPTATTNVTVGVTFMSIEELRQEESESSINYISIKYSTRTKAIFLAFENSYPFTVSEGDRNLPEQKLSALGWITLEWSDPRLKWSESDYDGITAIFATQEMIWKPQAVIDNSIEDLGLISDEDVLLRVENDGHVVWGPPMMYIVHCEIDVTFYPYDQQKCGVELTSWLSSSEVSLQHLFDGISLEDYRQNGEWEVVSTEISKTVLIETKNGDQQSYDTLHFWIYMKRRDEFYNTNVMLPIILSSFLVTLVFVVPVECGEKLSYTLTILLTIAVFLTVISDMLPAISLTTSVLGLYLAATLIASAVATLLTVGILFIYHKKEEPKVGTRFYNLSMKARKLCNWKVIGGKKKKEAVEEDGSTGKAESEAPASGDHLTWVQIAEVWDRLCFWVFIVVTLLLNIIFIAILAIGGSLAF